MHYIDEGDGPVVVMLHGNPTWSFYYRELIKGLSDRCRVVVPDHIGCGLSEKPQKYPYTLATHIDNLEALINHLDLDHVTLAVHDWGGAIGFGWATRNPDRVRRLVVFNTAAFLNRCAPLSEPRTEPAPTLSGVRAEQPIAEPRASARATTPSSKPSPLPTPLRIRVCGWPIVGELGVRGLNAFARSAVFLACKRPGGMSRQIKHGYLLPYDSYENRIAVLRFVRDIPTSPSIPSHPVLLEIEGALPTLSDKPMVIFWGMRDFCFHSEFLDEWITRFPSAAVHRFADAGHYVVEDAYEQIHPLLVQFVTT